MVLLKKWHNRGYYGAVAHNVQAIYAFYMGPYDGNPANLNPLAPAEAGAKYLEYMGGIDAVLPRAREDFERGEFRWVAQLMSHAVFADPTHAEARALAADAFEQLGYQAESATWRNTYLLAARELRHGKPRSRRVGNAIAAESATHLPISLLLDYLAIRLDGTRAAAWNYRIDWVMTDEGTVHQITLSRGALSHRAGSHGANAHAVIRTDRASLVKALSLEGDLPAALDAGLLSVQGDGGVVRNFFGALDTFSPMFAVVEP